MPVTLVEAVGSATANTYATLTEADAFAVARVNSAAWTAATDDQKKSALVQATRLLDRVFHWVGKATTSTQALMWPRNGMVTATGYAMDDNVIPQQLKDAESEWAIRLIEDSSIVDDNEAVKLGLQRIKVGPIDLEYQQNSSTRVPTLESYEAEVRRLGPDFDYLSKMVPDSVRVLIPPDWYEQGSITQTGDAVISFFGGRT